MANKEQDGNKFLETYFVDKLPDYSEGPIAGVYLIKHMATGRMYVGSSGNLYRRIKQHRSMLALGKHYSVDLQQVYNSDNKILIVVKRLNTIGAALDKEQDFLNHASDSEDFVNVANNARNSFQGLTHTAETKQKISFAKIGAVVSSSTREKIRQKMIGRVISQEARDKLREVKSGVSKPCHVQKNLRDANELKSISVIAGGSEYSSVSAAARAFNVDPKTVYNRIASKTDRFQDWKYSDKGTK